MINDCALMIHYEKTNKCIYKYVHLLKHKPHSFLQVSDTYVIYPSKNISLVKIPILYCICSRKIICKYTVIGHETITRTPKVEEMHANMRTDCHCISVTIVEGGLCYVMKYLIAKSERANHLNTECLFCCFIFKERVIFTGKALRIILASRGFSH
jgi:K+ transporter